MYARRSGYTKGVIETEQKQRDLKTQELLELQELAAAPRAPPHKSNPKLTKVTLPEPEPLEHGRWETELLPEPEPAEPERKEPARMLDTFKWEVAKDRRGWGDAREEDAWVIETSIKIQKSEPARPRLYPNRRPYIRRERLFSTCARVASDSLRTSTLGQPPVSVAQNKVRKGTDFVAPHLNVPEPSPRSMLLTWTTVYAVRLIIDVLNTSILRTPVLYDQIMARYPLENEQLPDYHVPPQINGTPSSNNSEIQS